MDKAACYDRDVATSTHDVVSAFIKSVRETSMPLHYLARMLVAGRDLRFIARRLMILASEDIGMAGPERAAGGGRRRTDGGAGSACPKPS